MREELKAARKREIETEIARKELVASLSHDIKTPLSVIKATGEVLDLKLGSMKDAGTPEEVEKEAQEALGLSKVIAAKADTIGSLMTEMMHANMEDLEPDNQEINSFIKIFCQRKLNVKLLIAFLKPMS